MGWPEMSSRKRRPKASGELGWWHVSGTAIWGMKVMEGTLVEGKPQKPPKEGAVRTFPQGLERPAFGPLTLNIPIGPSTGISALLHTLSPGRQVSVVGVSGERDLRVVGRGSAQGDILS